MHPVRLIAPAAEPSADVAVEGGQRRRQIEEAGAPGERPLRRRRRPDRVVVAARAERPVVHLVDPPARAIIEAAAHHEVDGMAPGGGRPQRQPLPFMLVRVLGVGADIQEHDHVRGTDLAGGKLPVQQQGRLVGRIGQAGDAAQPDQVLAQHQVHHRRGRSQRPERLGLDLRRRVFVGKPVQRRAAEDAVAAEPDGHRRLTAPRTR